MTNGAGDPPATQLPSGCHCVTTVESIAGYAVWSQDIGISEHSIEIQNIAGRNSTTAQKYITLGYVSPRGGFVPLKSGQQANDVDQWVSTDHRVQANATKIYMRVEDPATGDIICLAFSVAKVKK